MENKKEVVATIKAEVITEIIFAEPKPYEKQYGNLYVDDFEATIGVKVGNAVETLILEIQRKYVPSTGVYNTPTYVDSYYTPYTPKIVKNKFENLEKVGIEIDYSAVLETYQAAVWKAKDSQKAYKAELKRTHKNIRSLSYPTSWPLEFVNIITKDSNKQIKSADFILEPVGKFEYVHKGKTFIKVIYKNVIGKILKEDGRYVWTDGISTEKNENGYSNTLKISNGKTKRTKKEGTALLKFLEAVNGYWTIREVQKTRVQKEADEREVKRAKLEKDAGYPVVILSDRKYQRNFRGSTTGESYLVYIYKIITKQPESSYDLASGYSISFGKTYSEEENTYSVGNISKLNKKQFKTILDTILEGKETFKEVV